MGEEGSLLIAILLAGGKGGKQRYPIGVFFVEVRGAAWLSDFHIVVN